MDRRLVVWQVVACVASGAATGFALVALALMLGARPPVLLRGPDASVSVRPDNTTAATVGVPRWPTRATVTPPRYVFRVGYEVGV